MNVTIVRYKVKADRASENIDFISAVLDDGVESNPLPQTEAFKRFVGDIKGRCEEPPAGGLGQPCRRLQHVFLSPSNSQFIKCDHTIGAADDSG